MMNSLNLNICFVFINNSEALLLTACFLDFTIHLRILCDHFEEMLPYAVALNVGNQWCKKFHSVLSIYNYTPEWYGNDRTDSDYMSDIFASSFFSDIDRSVSIASTPLHSSSFRWRRQRLVTFLCAYL